MAKKEKLIIYGDPGEGKSTFISKSGNPFFITTDGNFEWLDLPEENHIQINSFTEFKSVVKDIIDNPTKYEKFNLIAVDLIEDVFKWCEYEYCKRNRVEHVGDIGYGKGYDISRNEFYIEVCKLLGVNKHIVLIAHGYTKTETNNRGVNVTRYLPSERIPFKVWDMLEGRVRHFLRVYSKDEETENGKFIKRRYLSLIPKQGEYGISRGLDETATPEDIYLDWNTFAELIGLNDETPIVEVKPIEEPKHRRSRTTKVEVVEEKANGQSEPEQPKVEVEPAPTPAVEEVKVEEPKTVEQPKVEKVVEQPKVEETKVVEQPKIESAPVVTPTATPAKEETMAERIARIRAQFNNR